MLGVGLCQLQVVLGVPPQHASGGALGALAQTTCGAWVCFRARFIKVRSISTRIISFFHFSLLLSVLLLWAHIMTHIMAHILHATYSSVIVDYNWLKSEIVCWETIFVQL